MSVESERCPGCQKPTPSSWCWDGRKVDCPQGLPPRWVADAERAVMELWRILRGMHERVETLSALHQQLRDKLGELADAWDRESDSAETNYTTCARQLRKALG